MGREKVIIDVEANTGKADKGLEKVKTTTKEVKNEAKDAAAEFSIMGISISSLRGTFTKVKGVAKGMFSSIKMGIASTGIGVLVLAVGALVSHFVNTKKGAEQLEVAFAAVGSAVSVITDRVSKFGGAIVKFFKGDAAGALKDVKDSFKGIGDEIREDVKLAQELTKTNQRLADAQRNLNVEVAKQRAEVEALKFVAEDTSQATQDRLDAAQKAFNIENDLMQKQIAIAEELFENKRKEVEMSESTAEDLDELAELEIRLADVRGESLGKQIGLNNLLNTIKNEQKAKEQEQREVEAEAETQRLAKIEEDAAKELEIKQKLEEDKKAADIAAAEAKKLLDEQTKQEELALAAQKEEILMNGLGTLKNVLGQESQAGKAIAVAEATINTFKGVSAAIGSAPPPFNLIAAATTLAAGFKNIKEITSVPKPQFASGGIVGGFGTGTSDSTTARLSKGESVINSRSTRMFKPLLSAINEAGGGRAFATGDGTGGATSGVVKAFVVADDMTKQQDKMSKIRRKATI